MDRLRQELKQEYEKEPRLRPFLRLLDAFDAPDIDFTSDVVDKIMADMREINKGINDEPSTLR